ncbi:PREDICTED: uncharacterized protein LOC106810283 [Priapulus caudatus]|uniref:Uncharacterized protein LOC106810283 n=1 Tax=Priapulus caudatus TaxID=37621 RepID=A0ABM1EA45_PRICU|nr:PREDICTED: uncharacterized protein LOC106810283 [Priapulus caudatus]
MSEFPHLKNDSSLELNRDVSIPECSDILVASREFDRLRRDRLTDGVRDGIAEGQEKALQGGFQDGFKHVVELACEISKLKAQLSTLQSLRRNSVTLSQAEELDGLQRDLDDLLYKLQDSIGTPKVEGQEEGCRGDGDGDAAASDVRGELRRLEERVSAIIAQIYASG